MARHQERSNREPNDRDESDKSASTVEPIDPTRSLGLWRRIKIRWRHRAEWNPDVWNMRVRFDELVAANQWDLAANIDELNERYRDLESGGR